MLRLLDELADELGATIEHDTDRNGQILRFAQLPIGSVEVRVDLDTVPGRFRLSTAFPSTKYALEWPGADRYDELNEFWFSKSVAYALLKAPGDWEFSVRAGVVRGRGYTRSSRGLHRVCEVMAAIATRGEEVEEQLQGVAELLGDVRRRGHWLPDGEAWMVRSIDGVQLTADHLYGKYKNKQSNGLFTRVHCERTGGATDVFQARADGRITGDDSRRVRQRIYKREVIELRSLADVEVIVGEPDRISAWLRGFVTRPRRLLAAANLVRMLAVEGDARAVGPYR